MKVIKLDLTSCQHSDDLHERIRVAFGFPEWYGKNWDAFWDLLWSECDADKVVITGEQSLPKEFGSSLLKMHEALDDLIAFRQESGLLPFSYEIIN